MFTLQGLVCCVRICIVVFAYVLFKQETLSSMKPRNTFMNTVSVVTGKRLAQLRSDTKHVYYFTRQKQI